MITGLQSNLTGNLLAIDERTVGATQVPQPQAKRIQGKTAVVPADRFAVGAKMAVLFPSDQELAIHLKRDQLPVVSSTDGFQFSN